MSSVDRVFHLASVPGGAAEQDFELGHRVNLLGTIALLEAARRAQRKVRLVFASSIAVFGTPMPPIIDEQSIPAPTMSYGAQKLIGETLVADYTRRGYIEGISLRLPGIVARPAATGMLSLFMSDVIRRVAAGEPFVSPISPQGRAWWMSRTCVVDNLLHAATLPARVLQMQRGWLLPVQYASMAQIVDALGRVYGKDRAAQVTYQQNVALEAQFGRMPPLRCPRSIEMGFRHDGSLENLVQEALHQAS